MRVHWNVVSAHPYKQLGFSEGGALPPVPDTEKRAIVSVAEGSRAVIKTHARKVVAGACTVNFLRRVSLAKEGPRASWAAVAA
jgi:hypothetical protein